MRTRKSTPAPESTRGPSPAFFAKLIVIGFVVIGGSVFIGRSDSGQINVASTIREGNIARQEAGGEARSDVASVPEAFRSLPNGGLQPQTEKPAEPTPEPATEDVGSTTEDGIGTTTDAGTDTEESEEVSTESPETTESANQETNGAE